MTQQLHSQIPQEMKMKTSVHLYMNVHSRIIQNSQKTDTTQMTISWWKDK